jgi:hypothetical protein
MLMDDGLIVTGVRHLSPDMRETLRRIYGSGWKLFGRWICKPYHLRIRAQGFIDNRGTFLTREQALARTLAHGQQRYRCGGDETELFSENLY